MQAVYNLVDLRPIIAAARQLAFADDTLEGYLPAVAVDDVDYRLGRSNRLDQTVPPRALDTPAAIIARPGAIEVRGGLPAFSAMDLLTESDLQKARRLAGLPVDLQLDTAACAGRATAAVLNTMETLRGQALFYGGITLLENGVDQAVDFGITTVTAGTALTDISAPAVTYFESWLDTYVAQAGGTPGVALTSRKMVRNITRNTQVINQVVGSAAGRTSVRLEELNGWLGAEGLPEFRTYDRTLKNVAGQTVRISPDNRIVFLPEPGTKIGETQYGITEESRELVANRVLAADNAKGIAVVTLVNDEPVQKAVKAAAIGMPVIGNGDTNDVMIVVAA